MVSVIFAVLEVSFWALTTVVKIPWKFLTLIFCCFITIFAARRPEIAVLAVMWCLSVCLSVCLSYSYILSKRINISSFFYLRVAMPFLFFHTKRYSNILTKNYPNEDVECTWGRQKSGLWPNIFLHRILWICDGQLLSTRLSPDTRLSIDACWS